MKKNIHQIDDNFREAFDNFQPEPPAMAWENIESNIPEKKKRRALLLPFMALAFVLGGLSSYFFFAKNTSNNFASVAVVLSTEKQENQAVTNNNTSDFSSKKQTQNQVVLAEKTPEKQINSNVFYKSKNTNTNLFFEKNKIQNVDNQNVVFDNFKEKIIERSSDFLNDNENIIKKRNEETLDLLATLKPNLVERKPNLKFGPETECYSFGGQPLKIKSEIEMFGGYEYAFRNLKNNSSETSKYAQIRDSSERYVIAYSGGIRYAMTGKSGFGLRVGVSASHLVERFDFVDAETTFIVKPTDPTQQPTVVRGKMTSQTYNRLTTFDIPLQVGFQTLNERSDWNFAVCAGDLLKLDFKTSGKILNPQGVKIAFNNPNVVFSPKAGLSLIGNFSIKRKINEHFTLNIEPNVLYHLKPLTVSDYALQQKYIKTGVQLGLIYGF